MHNIGKIHRYGALRTMRRRGGANAYVIAPIDVQALAA
jgi:hypothetical protein